VLEWSVTMHILYADVNACKPLQALIMFLSLLESQPHRVELSSTQAS